MTDKKYTEEQERIARFAKAMGHPARMAILQFLIQQESCFFGDIHDELPIAKATVSQHLKELKEAGLIQGEIEPPKVKYCIHKENWALAQKMFTDFFGQPICKKKGLLLSKLFCTLNTRLPSYKQSRPQNDLNVKLTKADDRMGITYTQSQKRPDEERLSFRHCLRFPPGKPRFHY